MDDKIKQALSAAKSYEPSPLSETFGKENVPAAQVSPKPGVNYGQIAGKTITQQNIDAVSRSALQILENKATRDFIAKHFGVTDYKITPVTGTWLGSPEPSFTIDAPNMTPAKAKRIAAAMGFGMLQDAAVHSVHHPGIDLESGTPTLLIGNGSVLSDDDRMNIMKEAAARGHDLTFTRDGKAAKFSHFGGPEEHDKFVDDVAAIANAANMPERLMVRTDGDLTDAKDYLKKIMGGPGSRARVQGSSGEPSDLFRGLVDHLVTPFTRAAQSQGYRFNLEKLADFHKLTDAERAYLYGKTTPPERKPPSGGGGFGRATVKDPVSYEYPGIYGNPKKMAEEAASRVAPESPNLKRLFGVTRKDLYDIGENRVGNMEPTLAMAPNPKGSAATEKIMNKKNEQRLIDILDEAGKHHALRHGMDAWYVMDPLYQAMEKQFGPDEAKRRFTKLNTLTGMASPGSEVPTEINRGMAAYYLDEQGRFEDFVKHAGKGEHLRGADFPEDIRDVMGHPYHSTSQALPMKNFLEKGRVEMGTPKVPTYIPASGVPETGFQTTLPVPDAHFTRIIGMGDTRTSSDPGVSMKMPEYQQVAPWWKNKIAGKMGLQSVPAQARIWGAGSGSTGVSSPIGAPKLEMFSDYVAGRAQKHGLTPEDAMQKILSGEIYAKGGKVSGENKFGSDAVQNAVKLARQLKRGRP
jgi:hypothetical protein